MATIQYRGIHVSFQGLVFCTGGHNTIFRGQVVKGVLSSYILNWKRLRGQGCTIMHTFQDLVGLSNFGCIIESHKLFKKYWHPGLVTNDLNCNMRMGLKRWIFLMYSWWLLFAVSVKNQWPCCYTKWKFWATSKSNRHLSRKFKN